jgi:hypothetical protein
MTGFGDSSDWTQALDDLLDVFADRVAKRLADRSADNAGADAWLGLADAADYLGVHRDSLRKKAKAGSIDYEQEAPGCRMYFRRSVLDASRQAGAPSLLAKNVAALSQSRRRCR